MLTWCREPLVDMVWPPGTSRAWGPMTEKQSNLLFAALWASKNHYPGRIVTYLAVLVVPCPSGASGHIVMEIARKRLLVTKQDRVRSYHNRRLVLPLAPILSGRPVIAAYHHAWPMIGHWPQTPTLYAVDLTDLWLWNVSKTIKCFQCLLSS